MILHCGRHRCRRRRRRRWLMMLATHAAARIGRRLWFVAQHRCTCRIMTKAGGPVRRVARAVRHSSSGGSGRIVTFGRHYRRVAYAWAAAPARCTRNGECRDGLNADFCVLLLAVVCRVCRVGCEMRIIDVHEWRLSTKWTHGWVYNGSISRSDGSNCTVNHYKFLWKWKHNLVSIIMSMPKGIWLNARAAKRNQMLPYRKLNYSQMFSVCELVFESQFGVRTSDVRVHMKWWSYKHSFISWRNVLIYYFKFNLIFAIINQNYKKKGRKQNSLLFC